MLLFNGITVLSMFGGKRTLLFDNNMLPVLLTVKLLTGFNKELLVAITLLIEVVGLLLVKLAVVVSCAVLLSDVSLELGGGKFGLIAGETDDNPEFEFCFKILLFASSITIPFTCVPFSG